MTARFVQVDVFTNHVFGGNALAVFPDGQGVPERRMQEIAREMNLSETVFVLPPSNADDIAALRIFTPSRELPFAGHPTIGTAFVLATEGRIETSDFSVEERVGRIGIHVEGELNSPTMIWMLQPLPSFDDPIGDRSHVAGVLGVGEADLLDVEARVGSAGVPFLFVGLQNEDAVDRVVLSSSDVSSLCDSKDLGGIFVFAPTSSARGSEVYSRMLGTGVGISEDPATGGASGPLGVFLVEQGIVPKSQRVEIVSRQGVAMGRPSDIFIRLGYAGEMLTEVRVGGRVVPVLEGHLTASLI